MNLNQIALPTTDFDRSVAFYRDRGFTLIVHSPPRYVRFECPQGDSTFSLHSVEDPTSSTGVVVYFEHADLAAGVQRLLEPLEDQLAPVSELEPGDPSQSNPFCGST